MRRLCVAFGFVNLLFAQTIPLTTVYRARQEQSDEHWAFMTRLPAAQIRELRLAAGLPDDGAERIENLDLKTLSSRNQILLVGGIGCLVLHVLQQNADAYKQVWSLSDVPDRGGIREVGAARKKICGQGPAKASAHVTSDGVIVVEIPVYNYPFQRTVPTRSYQYRWDGYTYNLVEE
jgi:hypothetical protein